MCFTFFPPLWLDFGRLSPFSSIFFCTHSTKSDLSFAESCHSLWHCWQTSGFSRSRILQSGHFCPNFCSISFFNIQCLISFFLFLILCRATLKCLCLFTNPLRCANHSTKSLGLCLAGSAC